MNPRESDMGDFAVTSKVDQRVPQLPIPGKRNILITSALPCVNKVHHLGNIIGCVLSADVFARYCSLRGYNTVYICGTDEYGMATPTKAMEEKCSPQEIYDKYHAIHGEVYEWFNISFQKFVRTSKPQQTELSEAIFKKLLKNDWISENTMQQLYCETCKRFLADRLVEGTCPTLGCDCASARGDQFENCQKLLNPTELKDHKCKVMFPSTLLGTGQDCTLMKTIGVTEYLNYEAGKYLKSKNIRVFGNDAKDTNIPVEVWRYYLLTTRPEVSETLLTWADLQAKLKSELLDNLGRFIGQVFSFFATPSGQGYGSIIPDGPHENSDPDPLAEKLAESVGKYVEQYIEAMEKGKLEQGLKTAMRISSDGNAYLGESRFPKLYTEDRPHCSIVMRTSVGLLHLLACLLEPFLPSFSHRVFKQLNLPPEMHISLSDDKGCIDRAKRPWDIVPIGHKIEKQEPLFKELKKGVKSLAVKLAKKLQKTEVSGRKKKKKRQTKKSAAAAEISISRLDIRVGLITKSEMHPHADSLSVEEIDVGEGQPRIVVSELVKYIPLEEMQNRKVCVLCNLKPVIMWGIISQAMVLTATKSDHTTVELVDPPKSARVGERVTFPGLKGELDNVLNPKKVKKVKKVWETLQVDLHTNTERVVCYKDIPLTTSAGVCTISSICGGQSGVSVEDIIRKVAMYFEIDQGIHSNSTSLEEKIFIFLRKLYDCELWLVKEFRVKEFGSLGYGEFLIFLEKYACLLPHELFKFLTGDASEKYPLEVCMLQHHLFVVVSQALNSLWEDEIITEQNILLLLRKQFPLVSFKTIENGSVEDFLSVVGKHKNTVISKCVLFSMTLCGTSYAIDSSAHYENVILKSTLVNTYSSQKAKSHESVTSKDAIQVLHMAPMMSDLNLWLHWDLLFAPSLGPLLPWLLNEVNTDELLCLVTKDGKVIRLDHSATVDSFLEAALQGSSFQTALKMLSLFSLLGGEKHVPVSLLKIHTQHAFEVILKNYLVDMEVYENKNSLNYGKPLSGQEMVGEVGTDNFCSELHRDLSKMNIATPVISRFVLECLGYLPAEFRGFATDVMLSGMQSVIKYAASAILSECSQSEHRLMLHEVGLSLGIVEWINDYYEFCSSDTINSNAVKYETGSGSKHIQDVSDKFSASEGSMCASVRADEQKGGFSDVCLKIGSAEVSDARIGSGYTQHSTEINEWEDAAQVIEAIRRDEFGLDSSLSSVESIMLTKQHARLGRALHCLSQELYSQDSHFLLELVQNADDNTYATNVEPTLTFILQDSGIIVLNNERGFSAQNIKALCDVGSSTKKGSNAGYIGQKGIGFKSVFRVTEAPEIHSNGFHIKFDISEGQIGFVLPTVVPPCDIDFFNRLTSSDSDQPDRNCWNTCIVLPFRSKLSDATVMKNIINMFSDLHPSLLLFLHRLQCIKLRNLLDDSLTVMRKEIVGDGIVKVSHGNKKMTWFVVSQKLQADFIRCDVQKTEISIAFTLKESDNGDYSPNLVQQPVFSFLPLRTYGLKFILQGDFVLPSSREEVDGDSPWNQWLLSEFPNLFVNAEKYFCALPCFRENPGRAVAAYMSFVPLIGEVHGFFSSLPQLIIYKLRMSNCLLLEGGNNEWVPPCKVLRGWNEQARLLLPDGLLHEHLGLGFLDKSIVLPDPLARALGVAEYGPKVLLQVMDSLCHVQNGLKSMGLGWLASWLSAFYAMSFNSSVGASFDFGIEMEFIENLRKLSLIPLADGTYGAVDEGPIWLHLDALSAGFKGQHGLESFPNLYSKLRIVSPALLSMSSANMSSMDAATVDKLTSMLGRIGVQQLSAHEIVKVHILPAISDNKITDRDKNLMTEYVCFVMVHLQSSCSDCHVEREHIISEIRNKAYISTNNGFKRPSEVSIHFSKEFGNPVDINKLITMVDIKWHEVDVSYLKHPVTKLFPCGLMKWREFFQQIGIMDFVKVVQVEKGITDMSDGLLKNVIWDKDLISLGSNVTDWESPELVDLLYVLARGENKSGCEYLLEFLDTLWDDCYSEKATGYCTSKSVADRKPFKSSFISNICDVKWVPSTMGNALHYPKDLYHDSDAVRSILGASAPFAVPKVRSGKFVSDIGFKTIVSLDDAMEVLKLWRCQNQFKASLAQMFRFYTLIWNEMTALKQKIAEEFNSGPSIFVPYASRFRHEDVVSGTFLSPEEVYWHDSASFVDQIEKIHPQCSSTETTHGPLNKTLCNFYPGLHDFFVDGCGVHETPPLCSYLQILRHLSNVALPSQAASAVFQVFLKWTDGLKSGLSAEDIVYLKDSLTKMQCMVLPTVQDKWVSLHPSFGLLCWCDDEKLSKQFKHLDGIDFLYFGELSKDDEEMLHTKVSILMQTLGIPALSEVVTREAIYYGLEDCSFKAAFLDWALPYAQRYLHSVHPDKYSQLKQSGFDILNRLQVVVVEKLFYRNTIRSAGGESQKQVECCSLLEGSILYTTQESDSHALFMELSRLFFNGNPELHLANFLHMITTMAESGSTEEQTQFFILNSQKVSKLPDGESVWSLSSVHSMKQNDKSLQTSLASTEGIVIQTSDLTPISVDNNWTIGDDSAASAVLVLPDSTDLLENIGRDCNETDSTHSERDPITLDLVSDPPDLGSSTFSKRDQLRFVTPNAAQAMQTGRLGEQVAFKYFIENAGKSVVKWVNENCETGLPYDIIVEKDNREQYIEVKATTSSRKDWLVISMRELQFAIEKGEAFSIAHVILLHNNVAMVSVYNNLAKLCQLRELQLAVMLPEHQKEFSVVS